MNRKGFLTALIALFVISVFSRNTDAYKERNFASEMIESGEHAPRPENQGFSDDYKSYVRAKAWNASTVSNISLSNTKELDFPFIGGRVRATLTDADNGIYLVAPSGGGLWEFSPDGSSFTPVNDLGDFLAITDIAQNPFNKQQIIIGTGDEHHGTEGAGAFVSDNGGKSFTLISSTSPDNNEDFSRIRFVKFSPIAENTIYMAAQENLYRSTNGGASWVKIFEGSGVIRSLDFTLGSGVAIAVQRDGVYISSTGNNGTFSLSTNGILSGQDVQYMVLASYASDRNIMYAVNELSGELRLFKTVNGGSSWVETANPVFPGISQGWFSLCIGVHPNNSNVVIIGSIGLGYSNDGGANWLAAGGFEVDFHDIRFHESTPDIAYIGYDQGFGVIDFNKTKLFWVRDENSDWIQEEQVYQEELGKNPGFNTMQVYYGDYYPEAYGDAYAAGYQDGGVMHQINGLNRRTSIGDGGSVFINKSDPNKSFASTQFGRVVFSDAALTLDGNFNQVRSSNLDYLHFITQFVGNNADGNQVYIASDSDVEVSSNDGQNWTSVATHSLTRAKLAIDHTQNPVVYLMGLSSNNENEIIRIENAATSPIVTTDVVDYFGVGVPDIINVDPNDKNTLFFASTWGNAYKYSNLDKSSIDIKNIEGDIPDVTFNTIIGVPGVDDLLIAGTNVGLFISEDGGDSWVLSSEIPHTQITDLKLRSSDNRLFVFTYGRGSFATTLDMNTVNIKDAYEVAFSVYPNPATNKLFVKIEGAVQVSIFDQSGKKVLESVSKTVNLQGLSKGAYIVHLKQDNHLVATQKVIVE